MKKEQLDHFEFIVLNLTDIDTQLKVYKKIIENNLDIEERSLIVDLTECYWCYDIQNEQFIKCSDEDMSSTDYVANSITEFFKEIKSIAPKGTTVIDSGVVKVFNDYVVIDGCQTITKKELEKLLEIMNK